MNQIQEEKKKVYYHLGDIDKTLDKLNAQNIEHLRFFNLNNKPNDKNDDYDSHLKALWEGSSLKN